ncbi:hypothetical protein MKZ07_23280 [Paenibacillus sp. FSL P4-0338]|uniref:hypothetical protein n=1 Tax=Paenibacillus sp. FSL P4-0338 TaxID=2921635 RepID=UPI0030F4BFBF
MHPRHISSKDYDTLMHQALEMGDRKWFEELAKQKNELQTLEEEARKDLGLKR